MEPVAFAIAVVPLITSTIASTQYNIHREGRSFLFSNTIKNCITAEDIQRILSLSANIQNDGLGQLRISRRRVFVILTMLERDRDIRHFEETHTPYGAYQNRPQQFGDSSEINRDILALQSDVLFHCRKYISPGEILYQRIMDKDAGGGWQNERRLEELCKAVMSCWQLDNPTQDPFFWRLQRSLMSEGTKTSLPRPVRLPKMLLQPSPTTLLVSWLAMAMAAVTYYETHPGHRYRNVFFLGSAFVAVAVGIIEQSNMDTIILTNIPWCLVLSILLDFSVHNIIRLLSSSSSGGESAAIQKRVFRKEKAILP
ncbi:hypothetical protein GQ44DRAFT_823248 [Phaeosphaeriaceae sp. PMI808]|nr:hypothetical protein GQ44DRAFT_823248 [Phaeosphaeriaceae sp. PMI808]